MAGIWLLLRTVLIFHTLLNTHYISLRPERGCADSFEHIVLTAQCFRDARQPDFGKGSACCTASEQPPNTPLALQRHRPNHCFSRNAKPSTSFCPVLYLYGRFSCQVRDQEVHGDVLAVDVFIHHVADGLRHHVGVQVGVVLERIKGHSVAQGGPKAASAHPSLVPSAPDLEQLWHCR